MNFKIYKNLIYQSISEMMAHRFSSICIVLFGLMFILIEIIAGIVYYKFSPMILGWSKNDYFILISSFNIINYGYQFFFILSHETLSEQIIKGDLDYTFIRPVNSFLFHSLYRLDFPSIVGLFVSILLFIFYSYKYISIYKLIVIFPMFIISILFVFLINQIIVTISFWTEKSEKLLALPEYIMDFSARPKDFYPKAISNFFTIIIPSFVATNSVADYVIGKLNYKSYIWFLFIVILLSFLSYFLWNRGMKKYQSAN